MITENFNRGDAKTQSFLPSRKPVIGSEGSIAREGEESPPNEMLQLDAKISKR